jgi:hypothetical protein
MDHIPEDEGPEVPCAAHTVIQEDKDAGVYLVAGGLNEDMEPVMVAGDGTITIGAYPQDQKSVWRLHRRRRAH